MSPDRDALVNAASELVTAGRLGEAAPAFEQAGRVLASDGRTREAAGLYVMAAELYLVQGQHAAGLAALEAAEPLALAIGELGPLQVARAELMDGAGDPPAQVLAAWQRAAAATSGELHVRAVRRIAALHLAAGQLAEARAVLGDAIATIAAAPEQADLEAVLRLERANSSVLAGELEQADQDLFAIAAGPHAAEPTLQSRVCWVRAEVARARGDLAGALELAHAARAAAVSISDVPAYLAAVAQIADLQALNGDLEGAQETLVRARVSLNDLGLPGAELVAPLLRGLAARLGA